MHYSRISVLASEIIIENHCFLSIDETLLWILLLKVNALNKSSFQTRKRYEFFLNEERMIGVN